MREKMVIQSIDGHVVIVQYMGWVGGYCGHMEDEEGHEIEGVFTNQCGSVEEAKKDLEKRFKDMYS